ncbi:MAG: 1-deoxy-D-xylulose-5-phosphate synthase [Treponema sp.]|jgi:1-deoxy-D-xylulose-5-phosphate synthase|nr:1-deoxy-D-xylulose-5-phosphate synthase [Treponema sp.]
MQENLLERIHGPEDLRGLSFAELNQLARDIRLLVISTVSRNGGHLASNLGVVELTIALHLVFNSPEDRIVWDVGHQCYAHKLITGRAAEFGALRKLGGLAGFPKTSESPHDAFNTGHASTSISAALGILAGDRLAGGSALSVAVIGDGALTGGLAYEALSHAGQLALPLVVILNDNKMSISYNVGALSKYLSRLSMKGYYQSFRRRFDAMAKRLPLVGDVFFAAVNRLKRAVKAVFYTDNFFVDLGFEYVGPIEGHNIQRLAEVFRDVRSLNRPVVVHVITQKGKGYQFAEHDPGNYHGVGAFSVSDGVANGPGEEPAEPSFTQAFGSAMVNAARKNSAVTAVCAAMESGVGLRPFKKEFPDRFFDAGIAEEHAATFAAGLAARGRRPVAAIYSTFMQRAVDQVLHDVCIQKLPVTFALDRSGFVSDDGETHQGLFDIALFRSAPNLTILAPAGEAELAGMLDWSLAADGPCLIRYPKSPCPPDQAAFHQPLEAGRGVWARRSVSPAPVACCLAFTGSLYPQVMEAAEILEGLKVPSDCYNLRFLKPVDEDHLTEIMNRYELAVFIEEGVCSGGFGEYVSALALRRNWTARTLCLAAEDRFYPQGKREELLQKAGLDGRGIADRAAGMYHSR